MNLFLTGDPGCGKTTVVRRVVDRLAGGLPVTGFYTEEIRQAGRRLGFRGVTLDGREFVLARTDAGGPFRVGPYGVLLEGLDSIGLDALDPSPGTRLVVLDEVGKMESFSAPFRAAVERLLEGSTPVLGTVAAHGTGLPKRVRQDPRVTLVRMSRAGRDGMVGEILRRLAAAGVGDVAGARRRRAIAGETTT